MKKIFLSLIVLPLFFFIASPAFAYTYTASNPRQDGADFKVDLTTDDPDLLSCSDLISITELDWYFEEEYLPSYDVRTCTGSNGEFTVGLHYYIGQSGSYRIHAILPSGTHVDFFFEYVAPDPLPTFPPPPPPPTTTVFFDDFSDTDGKTLTQHNSAWTPFGDLFAAEIFNNAARALSNFGGGILTGYPQSGDSCTSLDVTLPLSHEDGAENRVYIVNKGNDRGDERTFVSIRTDEFDSSFLQLKIGDGLNHITSMLTGTHNVKMCQVDRTITAYVDGVAQFSDERIEIDGDISGFAFRYPFASNTIDNFRVEADAPANAVPVLSSITAPTTAVQSGTQITASATFTDADTSDTHTAVWNWGDGTTSNATVTETNGSGSISDAHTYAAAGVYELTLTITDSQTGQDSEVFQYVTVYDPSAGWASGGKEFISPAGAVVGNAGATGKADFGFQVKYHQGDIAPSGQNVELSFPAGNINFVSTAYEWLTVTGTKATLKATGTLNGVAGYTVLVSVIDQGTQNGLVRFQIKNASNTVIYDTQSGAGDTADPTTSVSKGKIKVN